MACAGGGGSGGGGYLTSSVEEEGEVLGATTTEDVIEPAPTCDTYLTTFIKAGQKNDPEQVTRLQGILKDFEGADVEENGEYDGKTLAAVLAFQGKYASEILTPWGLTKPTGFVYLTTRKKLNEVRCENTTTFPLTQEEEDEIAKNRNVAAAAVSEMRIPTPQAEKPTPAPQVEASEEPEMEEAAEPEAEELAVTLPGSRFSDFFRRLFDRFR